MSFLFFVIEDLIIDELSYLYSCRRNLTKLVGSRVTLFPSLDQEENSTNTRDKVNENVHTTLVGIMHTADSHTY